MDTDPAHDQERRSTSRGRGPIRPDPDRIDRRLHRALAVIAVTVTWVLAVLALFAFNVGAGLCALGGEPCSPAEAAHQDLLWTLLLIALIAGPAVIAAVAFGLGLRVTAVVYLLLAGVLAATVAIATGGLGGAPRPEPEPSRGGCVEHSGGDTRCPGG